VTRPLPGAERREVMLSLLMGIAEVVVLAFTVLLIILFLLGEIQL
jgi:hypothetical protein